VIHAHRLGKKSVFYKKLTARLVEAPREGLGAAKFIQRASEQIFEERY